MHNLVRIKWFVRMLFYKFFLKRIIIDGYWGYIGKPLFWLNFGQIKFGRKVRIFPLVRVEVLSYDAYLEIGGNVSIGHNFHIVCANKIIIHENVTISANVFIADSDNDYREIGKPVVKQKLMKKETTIGSNCFIGYGAVILPGTILGKQCIVGANSVVKGVYPDYSVIAGVPAKVIKKYKDGEWSK